jgi:hypothetical protein
MRKNNIRVRGRRALFTPVAQAERSYEINNVINSRDYKYIAIRLVFIITFGWRKV